MANIARRASARQRANDPRPARADELRAAIERMHECLLSVGYTSYTQRVSEYTRLADAHNRRHGAESPRHKHHASVESPIGQRPMRPIVSMQSFTDHTIKRRVAVKRDPNRPAQVQMRAETLFGQPSDYEGRGGYTREGGRTTKHIVTHPIVEGDPSDECTYLESVLAWYLRAYELLRAGAVPVLHIPHLMSDGTSDSARAEREAFTAAHRDEYYRIGELVDRIWREHMEPYTRPVNDPRLEPMRERMKDTGKILRGLCVRKDPTCQDDMDRILHALKIAHTFLTEGKLP